MSSTHVVAISFPRPLLASVSLDELLKSQAPEIARKAIALTLIWAWAGSAARAVRSALCWSSSWDSRRG